jgi:hypothetical protein
LRREKPVWVKEKKKKRPLFVGYSGIKAQS